MEKIKWYLHLSRPHQYVKNGLIWLPLFFGYRIDSLQAIVSTLYTFIAFCLVSSAVYVINDLKDISEDRLHPIKKFRPLASGRIGAAGAIRFSMILFAVAFLFSFRLLPRDILFVLAVYLILNIAYTFFFKRYAILDITCIAIGFVLRIYAGGISADVAVSQWIVIMTFLLAVFLALAKRQDDLVILAAGGCNPRTCISGYNREFVSASMMVMASVITVSYILYTVSPEVTAKHATNRLYLTAFWVVLGLLRYLQITFVENRSGDPTMLLIKDRFLRATIFFWLVSVYLILYHFHSPSG